MKTTRERRDNLIQWLESRGGPLRGYTVTYGHLQPAIEDCNELEDGIRALADQLDTEPPDNTLIHDGVGTVADVAKRLRALLDD